MRLVFAPFNSANLQVAMRFELRMLLVGLVCLPAGMGITWMGFQETAGAPVFPAGKYLGPLAAILGVTLIVMTIRSLSRGE